MSELQKHQVEEYCNRARTHYRMADEPDAPAYHHWGHALDVREKAQAIALQARQSGAMQLDESLLAIAATWHDAAHHEPLHGFAGKEERSAALVAEYLPELSAAQLATVQNAIIDTTITVHPKSSYEGIALHFADVGYLASPSYEHFYRQLSAMKKEWGTVNWNETINRTKRFAQQVIGEAALDLVTILPSEQVEAWIGCVGSNVQKLAAGEQV